MASDAEHLLVYRKAVLAEADFFVTRSEEVNEDLGTEQARLEKILIDPAALATIVEHQNQIVGYLHFRNAQLKRISHTGEFGMSLSSEFRDEGVGTILLRLLLDWPTANPQIEKVMLKVFATNTRAIALYQKNGFIKEGHLIRDLKLDENRYVDTLLMAKFVK